LSLFWKIHKEGCIFLEYWSPNQRFHRIRNIFPCLCVSWSRKGAIKYGILKNALHINNYMWTTPISFMLKISFNLMMNLEGICHKLCFIDRKIRPTEVILPAQGQRAWIPLCLLQVCPLLRTPHCLVFFHTMSLQFWSEYDVTKQPVLGQINDSAFHSRNVPPIRTHYAGMRHCPATEIWLSCFRRWPGLCSSLRKSACWWWNRSNTQHLAQRGI
jgi:hypothetical protein